MKRERTDEIRAYILDHVEARPGDIARRAAQAYGITRQAVNRHLQALVDEALLEAEGQTRAKTYRLRAVQHFEKRLHVTPVIQDARLWREYVEPLVAPLPENVREVCRFAFTAAVENVIDHARATRITVAGQVTASAIALTVADDGRGIFAQLVDALSLEDPEHAIFELAKGGLTTDPERRSGASLFYAARLMDQLRIHSASTALVVEDCGDRWRIERTEAPTAGTVIMMTARRRSGVRASEVLETFAAAKDTRALERAHVPVALLARSGEALVSRAQAHRLLSRLERCNEAILDFRGVEAIGPAFADEIFRSFRAAHPRVNLVTLNASAGIRHLIRQALGA
ncbi:MAG: DUF4325 domain-containing protein [Candidatus Krumholzibacteria bacterium]|nr:DUF4325 domain-containing protein [Candidatus Krumholzibacteria bacterium]